MPETRILAPTPEGITRAAEILSSGGLVAFPTETVYGLGADATNDRAVARVFEAKGRPSFNPLIAHVANIDAAKGIAHFDDAAAQLAEAFWPGPLTLVLPMRETASVSQLVTAGGDLIAVRVPERDVAQNLLSAFGRPIAAPSANPSGRISPTTAQHVLAGLDRRIDAVLDGGTCNVGVESTIVGLDGSPTLLRAGGIPTEALAACLGEPLKGPRDTGEISAPGQLASHYAPDAKVRLNVSCPEEQEVFIGFGAMDGDVNLSRSGDLVEAAANLFSMLHLADATGKPIAVASIPTEGLGLAINDRLLRAAAPRE